MKYKKQAEFHWKVGLLFLKSIFKLFINGKCILMILLSSVNKQNNLKILNAIKTQGIKSQLS